MPPPGASVVLIKWAESKLPGTSAWRAARNVGLIVAVALLAGATVFVDEVVHGRSVEDELAVDAAVGVPLAATALLAGWVVLRIAGDRAALRRGEALSDAVRTVTVRSHTSGVLAGLCRQASEVIGVDRVLAVRPDPHAPGRCVVAAGHGDAEAREDAALEVGEGPLAAALSEGRSGPLSPTEVAALLGVGVSRESSGIVAPCRWGGRVHAAVAAVALSGQQLGSRDLERLENLAELGSIALEHAEMRTHFERAAQAGVEALATAVDRRDNYTGEHSQEVVELALAVGTRLGLGGPELSDLEATARLHDVGKIGVPDAILSKPGPLDRDEWTIVKQHPDWGAEMLAKVPELTRIAVLVRHGHERWDGGGYPDGLRGEEIPLPSRIVLTCDAFHAMTSDRPYRSAMDRASALRELEENAGSQFDPRTVEALRTALVS